MKSWQELTITDDFLFCKVMSQSDLCKEMIELLLNIKIERIENIQIQKQLNADYDAHGIRMDVYVQDSNHVYDIEMQTTDKHNIEKRSRYYQSLIDIDQLSHKMDYRELKESFIIFICTFDPFGKDLLSYTVKQVFDEDSSLTYNDNSNKLFYNLTASELQQKNSKLGTFLRYLKTCSPGDEYTSKIQQAVTVAKYNLDWRKEYMTVGMLIAEEKNKSFEEGYMKARLEAARVHGDDLQKVNLENAVISVKEFCNDVRYAAEKYAVPLEVLEKALENN